MAARNDAEAWRNAAKAAAKLEWSARLRREALPPLPKDEHDWFEEMGIHEWANRMVREWTHMAETGTRLSKCPPDEDAMNGWLRGVDYFHYELADALTAYAWMDARKQASYLRYAANRTAERNATDLTAPVQAEEIRALLYTASYVMAHNLRRVWLGDVQRLNCASTAIITSSRLGK